MSSRSDRLKLVEGSDERLGVFRDDFKRGEFSGDHLECHRSSPFASLEALSASGVVDQKLSHDTPDAIEEMFAILPLACIMSSGVEADEGFIHDKGGLKID